MMFYYKLDVTKASNMITIQRTDIRSFTYFGSHDSFICWYATIPIHMRCFDEVITSARKFIIDLDCSDVNDITIDEWNNVTKLYAKYMIKVLNNNDILIYDSNGKNKLSCHIISTSIYTRDGDSAYNIARDIYEMIEPNYRKYMDLSIYKNLQFMRIEGSRKPDSQRYLYLRNNHRIYDLKLSMLSNISGCNVIVSNNMYKRNPQIGIISSIF